jgi:hypothetical protein
MSNYVKSTNFYAKDALSSGNPDKIIKGAEIDDEFNALATAIATKADTNSPTFTGMPVAPTAASGTNTTQVATTAFVQAKVGTPGTMSTQNATAVAITGGTITGLSSALPVASGGTGLATLTANNVMLGNGTSAPSFVAPSTSGNVLTSNGTTWTSAAPAAINQLTLMTAQATTSGTTKDFTGIPSWVKRITVIFNGVSVSGFGPSVQVQLGTVSGIETTGYSSLIGTNNSAQSTSTSAFLVADDSLTTSTTISGTITISLISGTTFISSTCCADVNGGNPRSHTGGGNKTLASALTQLRVLSNNAFDAGSVNVMYE